MALLSSKLASGLGKSVDLDMPITSNKRQQIDSRYHRAYCDGKRLSVIDERAQ